jgi:hypothetical protein
MTRPLFALAAAALLAGPAAAQRPKVKIDDARVGLPAGGGSAADRDLQGRASPVAKRNAWAPVYVRLELLGEYEGGVNLKVETADADDLRTSLIVPLLPTLKGRNPGEKIEPAELPYLPYARLGDRVGEVTLTVMSAPTDGSRPKELSEPFRFTNRDRLVQFKEPASYVVLGLGSRLPGFELPADKAERKGQNDPNANAPKPGFRGGRVQTAVVTGVRELPDQWFGYAACDLVVLNTGAAPQEFLDELFDPDKSRPFAGRRDALFEWVRRGGKLVVSVGQNAGRLAQSPVFQDLLPLPVSREQPTRAAGELPLRFAVPNAVPVTAKVAPRSGEFPVARFVRVPNGKPARVALATADTAAEPVVAQAAFGLGRVTAVAFDLDSSPFTEFTGRPEFWDWLIREAGTARGSLLPEGKTSNVVDWSRPDAEDELAAGLRTAVDTFEGVPVISFGWVALFIVLYTLLIGPVEYFFLKKVVGRLELTWVTFPLIVLSVSGIAYVTAYAIKGNDLKLNKVDLVDVDLGGGRVYGRTWFTLFSPRIESYTVGVEPRAGWAKAAPDAPLPAPLVDWMAGGRGGGGGSIISRGYGYHSGADSRGQLVLADGLVGVPVQVWSTKAFTASWVGEVDKAAPLVQADLFHPPADPAAVTGSLVSNLPVGVLADPVLVYAGRVYKLPPLTPGQKVDVPAVSPEAADGGPRAEADWFAANAGPDTTQVVARAGDGSPTPGTQQPLWRALFHERMKARTPGSPLENASLRELDQSWRLADANRDEVMLLAKVPAANGPAEQLLTAPDGPAATTLWLKGLPGQGEARTAVPGTLRQETYIRVFIPLKPAGR